MNFFINLRNSFKAPKGRQKNDSKIEIDNLRSIKIFINQHIRKKYRGNLKKMKIICHLFVNTAYWKDKKMK